MSSSLSNIRSFTRGNHRIYIFLRNRNYQIIGNNANGRISKRVFQKKTRHVKFSEKRTFIYKWVRNVCFSENLTCFFFLETPLLRFTCAYQGVRNVRFSENLTCFLFFKKTPVLRFALLLYHRQNKEKQKKLWPFYVII